MTDMATLLEARALVKRLGGRLLVDGVDLDCHAGQVLGLLGPNGAGKTTTLRMLYGFLSADGGTIRFEGADVSKDLDRFKRQLGVCAGRHVRRGLHGAPEPRDGGPVLPAAAARGAPTRRRAARALRARAVRG
jgi:ABC-type cobalamin/Fe3+-siderophores transport system ATPase subunit